MQRVNEASDCCVRQEHSSLVRVLLYMLVGMKCQIGCYYYLQLVSIDAYCGESTGNFIFHILIGCIIFNLSSFSKKHKMDLFVKS